MKASSFFHYGMTVKLLKSPSAWNPADSWSLLAAFMTATCWQDSHFVSWLSQTKALCMWDVQLESLWRQFYTKKYTASYYCQHCKSAPTIISLSCRLITGDQSSSATRESNLLLSPGLSFWLLAPFGPSLCKSPHCTTGQGCKYPVLGRLLGRSREAIAGYPSMKNAPLRRDRAQPVP